MLLKWKNKSGWEILYKNFFEKVIGICNNVLQKGNNLSDLPDKAAARANLGINDIFMTTDGGKLKGPLEFANNTWNPVGDDAYFGDKNKAGHFAIKSQKTGTPTGLALVAANSSDDSNYASIKYDGTNVTINKPLTISGGFTPENVAAINLDNYNKLGFIWGSCNSSSGAELTSIFGTGSQDYGGLVFGAPIPSTGDVSGGELGQLIFMGNKLAFREKDGMSPDVSWTPWKQIAFKSDVDIAVANINLTNYAKTDASNIAVATWSPKLATGVVNSTDTKAVSGKTVYNALNAFAPNGSVTSGNTKAVSGGTVYTALTGYAKTDASNLTAAQKNAWGTAVATGSVNSSDTKAVSGKTVNTAITSAMKTLRSDVTEMTTNLVKVSDHGTATIVGRSTSSTGYGKLWCWYRIYSDNWVEQGGHYERPADNSGGSYQVVTLPVTMADKQYLLVATKEYNTTNYIESNFVINLSKKTTTSFGYTTTYQGGSSGNGYNPINWYACGYRKASGAIELPTQADYRTVTFNRSGPYDFVVTYTSPEGSSASSSNPASIFIKPNTKIKIRNDDYGYGTQVKSGSTVLASLVNREEYTSGNLSANTTFTIVGYRDESYWNDDSGCCVAEGTLIPCLQNNTIILKKIEDVCAGDTVIGANGQANEVYARTDTVLGATRTMYTFIDKSLYFTGEHSMWVKYDGQEYFGIHDVSGYYREALATVNGQPLLEWEQENAYRKDGVVGKPISKGLSREPLFVVFDAEYGTDKGWKHNKAIIAKDKVYPDNTPVHTLIVGGNHTYFANGYLVSGFATDADYDYDQVEIKDLDLF